MPRLTMMTVERSLQQNITLPDLFSIGTRPSNDDVVKWIVSAKEATDGLERLLGLKEVEFWSTILFDQNITAHLDLYLDVLAKICIPDEYHVQFTWDEKLASHSKRLMTTLLAVVLKCSVRTKDSQLTSKQHVEFLNKGGVMKAERFIKVCANFSQGDTSLLLSTVLRRMSEEDNRLKHDISDFGATFIRTLTDLAATLNRWDAMFGSSEGAEREFDAQNIHDGIQTTVELLHEAVSFVCTCRRAGIFPSISWITGFGEAMDSLWKTCSEELIIDVSITLVNFPLKRLLSLRAKFENLAAQLFENVLTSLPDAQRFQPIQDVLACERFVYVFNDLYPLRDHMKNCSKEQIEYVERQLIGSCLVERSKEITQLERSGVLRGLGELDLLGEDRRNAVLMLVETLPQLSLQYAHLCLRHFDYNVTVATQALLTRDEALPGVLRRLEGADLTPKGLPHTLPAISFKQHDIVLTSLGNNEKANETEKNLKITKENEKKGPLGIGAVNKPTAAGGLFSLSHKFMPAPVVVEVPQTLEEIIRAKAEQTLSELRESVLKLRIRKETVEDEEKLVPMPNAKKYAGVNKFKTLEADRVAIRPTYEQYKYETVGSDDDLYDDEYDDAYEQKEFKIEPLNPLESSSSDDENGNETKKEPVQNTGRENEGFMRGGGRGGRGSRGSGKPLSAEAQQRIAAANDRTTYHGGRDRQFKERRKNQHRQRGSDRKMRGGMGGPPA